VTAGSFRLNGRLIEVRADDSITSVLERISENVPGVGVSFAEDRVHLRLVENSREPIVVSDDSSGFLAAVKLQGAVSVTGSAAGDNERLVRLAQFGRVQAGGFRVGGRYVGIDPTVDSMSSVLERIRQSAPGVVAFLDDERRLVVRSGAADRMELSDDSSGFLAAVGLATGPELPVRQRFVLDAAAAQRVQQAAHSEKAELVNRTLAALELPSIQEAAAMAGRARAALAAYDRSGTTTETDEASLSLRRKARDWPPDEEPVRGARRNVVAWGAIARNGPSGSASAAADPAR
jgi:hypothetical protein